MPKKITPLTDSEVHSTKPRENQYKLFDGGGLFLLVTPWCRTQIRSGRNT